MYIHYLQVPIGNDDDHELNAYRSPHQHSYYLFIYRVPSEFA